MKPSKVIDLFLEEYRFTLSDKEKSEFATKGYNILGFGSDRNLSDRLINLIVKGRKRANSRLYNRGRKLPEVDSYGIVLNHQNDPCCLVQYTGFDIKPFSKVGLEFAEEEGEATGDIHTWIEERREHFKKEGSRFNDSSLILCEKFRLVFKVI